jgi:hypothetical protein
VKGEYTLAEEGFLIPKTLIENYSIEEFEGNPPEIVNFN